MPLKKLMQNAGLIFGLMLISIVGVVAQDDTTTTTTTTTTDTTTELTSTINYFFVACEDRFVVDFDGTMQTGYDIYFTIFRGLQGSGETLVARRQLSVDGAYTVSQEIFLPDTERIGVGESASARIQIASETAPDTDILFDELTDDFNDTPGTTCFAPQYTTDATSSSVGSNTVTEGEILSYGLIRDPQTGEIRNAIPGEVIGSAGIVRPDGGLLNQIVFPAQEAVVQVGTRPSEDVNTGRTSNPGLIFAECEDYPLANPGRLFDTDGLVLYWSWFAATPAQVYDHINNAQYFVTVAGRNIPFIEVRPVVQLSDGNYWVFYVATLGDSWSPGTWDVEFQLTWRQPITDGFENFGPGTANPGFDSGCQFTVEANPYGINQPHIYPADPLQQFLGN